MFQDAVDVGAYYGLSKKEVAKIINAYSNDLMVTKTERVTIEIEVDLEPGRALYLSNIEVSEKNGIPVKVVSDGGSYCLATNPAG